MVRVLTVGGEFLSYRSDITAPRAEGTTPERVGPDRARPMMERTGEPSREHRGDGLCSGSPTKPL